MKKTHSSKKNKSKLSSNKISDVVTKTIDWPYLVIVVFLAILCGSLHSYHVSSLFEKQRFFSHLSTLERELSFRTEMGLYYSYYKTISEAPSFYNGLSQLIYCNLTEYPDTINVLRRFNLYPEVILGGLHRIYRWYGETFKIKLQDCYSINRGHGMSQVESCVGMGDVAHFYVFPIFWLSGFMISCMFLVATYLSGTVLGGIITVVSFFYNHGEATRVMWTPPLRESFSFPLLVVQLGVVIYILKHKQPSLVHTLLTAFATTLFMLPWQFAQFALWTQVCALFGLYLTKFVTAEKLSIILYGLLIAHSLNFILQFANTLLISSFFMAACISALIVLKCERRFEVLKNKLLIMIVQSFSFIFLSLCIKIGVGAAFHIKDDAHIFDILRAKFTDYKDFHTLLYICAPEFDFIGFEYPKKLIMTLLLPSAALSVAAVIYKVLQNEVEYYFAEEKGKQETLETKPFAEHMYLILQTVAYLLMAVLLMRLKLFSTPALCLLTCFLASRKVFDFIKRKDVHYGLIFLVLGLMSVQGYKNLSQQLGMINEYNNPQLEGLIEWINANTRTDTVFAGAMPTMAAVKLSCKRSIVNHPHYEDSGLRARTKRVYQVYSRKSCSHVYNDLKAMSVTHLVLEGSWCTRRTRVGCSLPEVWDVEDVENRKKEPCCSVLERGNLGLFKLLYRNDVYTLLKL